MSLEDFPLADPALDVLGLSWLQLVDVLVNVQGSA